MAVLDHTIDNDLELTKAGFQPTRAVMLLWVLALVAAAGDIVLTHLGLQLGLTELNPLARTLIASYGHGMLLVLKVPAICLAILCWCILPNRWKFFAPLLLALPWGLATVLNLMLIVSAL